MNDHFGCQSSNLFSKKIPKRCDCANISPISTFENVKWPQNGICSKNYHMSFNFAPATPKEPYICFISNYCDEKKTVLKNPNAYKNSNGLMNILWYWSQLSDQASGVLELIIIFFAFFLNKKHNHFFIISRVYMIFTTKNWFITPRAIEFCH